MNARKVDLVLCAGPTKIEHPNIVWWDGSARLTSCAAAGPAGGRSLIDYIEYHAAELRDRYLRWVHDFGELPIAGRRLRERFRLSGVSLWDQTVFVEKSRWKQPSLEVILRVMAVERILDDERPASLLFVGHDRDVKAVLKGLCSSRGVTFFWKSIRAPSFPIPRSVKDWVRLLPQVLQGASALGYLAGTRLNLRNRRRVDMQSFTRRAVIVAPLFNYRLDASGDFVSNFWTSLPRVLAEEGFQILWLHFFYAHSQIPSVSAAKRAVDALNRSRSVSDFHCLLDTHLDLRGWLRILWCWVKLVTESIYVGRILRKRGVRAPAESFWPLIRGDWARAFRGIGCVEALFFAECFEMAFSQLPRQDEGIYLMENQGWERALSSAWRANDHGRLTGVVHSSIRFWDLRYHECARAQYPGRCDARRGPDIVALNGSAMYTAYRETHPDDEAVAVCEALRYLDLKPRTVPTASDTSPCANRRVLILGEYLDSDCESLLRFIERCQGTDSTMEYWLKPHPNAPVHADAYPKLRFVIRHESVSELVQHINIAIAGKSTTAALDALVCGAKVLIYEDGLGLNYSPVRGMRGVSIVRTPDDFRRVVGTIVDGADEPFAPEPDLLLIDPKLPRWRDYFTLEPTASLRAVE